MITGEKLMVYLGVALMLLGAYIILSDALSLTPNIVTALGGFVFSMGLIMSYVGYKGKDREEVVPEMARVSESSGKHSLGYLSASTERSIENQRKSSGYRALGFVLSSIGIFVLGTLVGVPLIYSCCNFDTLRLFGLFLNPLGIFGIVCLSFGMFFRKMSHR